MLQQGDCLGDWIVERPLGGGAMGQVLLCHSRLSDDLRAAVKVVTPAASGQRRTRFVDELRTLASLRHPGIVGVRSGGEDEDRGLAYMAMEYVEGWDLEQRLERGPMDMDEIRAVFVPLSRALAYAHGRGVHHRDIKPANIMLRTWGDPVLVDFGVAARGPDSAPTAGMMTGTAAYMPPEVFRGETPQLALCDMYALGVTLWETLCGHPAFSVDASIRGKQRLVEVAKMKARSGPLDPGPLVPESIRTLVRQMTDPDPALRLHDLGEVTRVLTERERPVVTWGREPRRVSEPVPVAAPPYRLIPSLAWVALAAAALVATGVVAASGAAAGL